MTLTPEDDKQWLQHIAKSWFRDWLKRKINQEEDSMPEITKDERKLIAALLRLASGTYSNHGCNDFDLRQYKLEHMAPELNELEWGAVTAEDKNNPIMTDWLLMRRLADKLDPQ